MEDFGQRLPMKALHRFTTLLAMRESYCHVAESL